MVIPFNRPFIPCNAKKYIKEVFISGKIAGDHDFTKKCHAWIQKYTKAKKTLLTTSCTHALEMAALLIGVKSGDEVIMSSYAFPSTANAFALRGARIVFIDIRPDTMNINENLIEQAITPKTKAIIPLHYAGVGCEMDKIIYLKKKYKLFIVEDSAQCLMATYKGRMLGAIGDIGCYSFHETKNYQCGEGGAIVLHDAKLIRHAEMIREKGTNRSQFFRGEVDKYSWKSIGSSYLPSDINAALLYAQLEMADQINKNRLNSWNHYYQNLKNLENKEYIELPKIPVKCNHNAHMFYIKVKNLSERTKLIKHLKARSINALFHYVPLHSSLAGKKYGTFYGRDRFTTAESERLLRLPLYYNMPPVMVERVCRAIENYFVKGD
jgi:dTDP-4-amino-4,6-dideoxygalactose transaminase